MMRITLDQLISAYPVDALILTLVWQPTEARRIATRREELTPHLGLAITRSLWESLALLSPPL